MISRFLNLPRSNNFFLFGPRQTGKTSLIRACFPDEVHILTINLLHTEEFMRLSARPQLLREEVMGRHKNITHVFIDEVQRIPAILDEIHHLLESPNPPFFILTGSSARKLKRSGANLLGGRAWMLRLYPLTSREIGKDFVLERALNRGTLPKIWFSENTDATQLLRSYVETYLKEEIEAEALVRSTGTFIRFLFQAGHESGKVLNFSTIARDVATSSKTVKEYFQILEDTLVGRFLPAYSKSSRRRLASHPKFYLFDCGVQRALVKRLTVPIERGDGDYGTAFEHFVINECFRLNDYLQRDFEFTFYRTEHGAEIDLVIEKPDGKCLAVEIKSSADPALADVRSGLMSFREIRPDAQLICVCTAVRRRQVEGVLFLPWHEFLIEHF